MIGVSGPRTAKPVSDNLLSRSRTRAVKVHESSQQGGIPYSGRAASVPVSKQLWLKGGATGVTRFVRAEVSRGRSTALLRNQRRREGPNVS